MSELNEDNNNYDDCIFNMTKTETETNLNSIIVDENDENEENKENKNSKKDNVILTKCDNISKSIVLEL